MKKIIAILIILLLPVSSALASLTFTNAGTNRVNFGSGASTDNLNTTTMLMWVNFSSLPTGNGGGLWDKSEAGYANFRQFAVLSNGSLLLEINRATTSAKFVTATSFVTTGWNFVGWSWDGSAAPKAYRGSLTALASEPGSYSTQTAGSGTIGDDSANNATVGNLVDLIQGLGGSIATIQIFNTELSLGQIRQQQFFPHKTSGTVLYSWLGFNGTGTQADFSGNNNAGTVTGASQSKNVPLGS